MDNKPWFCFLHTTTSITTTTPHTYFVCNILILCFSYLNSFWNLKVKVKNGKDLRRHNAWLVVPIYMFVLLHYYIYIILFFIICILYALVFLFLKRQIIMGNCVYSFVYYRCMYQKFKLNIVDVNEDLCLSLQIQRYSYALSIRRLGNKSQFISLNLN